MTRLREPVIGATAHDRISGITSKVTGISANRRKVWLNDGPNGNPVEDFYYSMESRQERTPASVRYVLLGIEVDDDETGRHFIDALHSADHESEGVTIRVAGSPVQVVTTYLVQELPS